MWIHFNDIPVGAEFVGFFGTTRYRKTSSLGALNLDTDTIEWASKLLHGFADGYFYFR